MQVEAVAGQLAGHIGAAGAADARLPDTEPSGVDAICAAIVSSYLRISLRDPEGVLHKQLGLITCQYPQFVSNGAVFSIYS